MVCSCIFDQFAQLRGLGVFALDLGPDEQYAGLTVGAALPGKVEVEGVRYDTDVAYSFGIFYDFPGIHRLHYGFGVDFNHQRWTIPPEDGGTDVNKTLISVSGRITYYLGSDDDSFGIRPVLALGYGTLPSQQIVSTLQYFTIRGGLEALLDTFDDFGLMLEGFVWYTPAGKDDDEEIRIGPTVIFRGGIVF